MITIKTAGYTIAQLSVLRDILHDGILKVMDERCVPPQNCEVCAYSYLCTDLVSTVKFLDNKIDETKRKFCLFDNS